MSLYVCFCVGLYVLNGKQENNGSSTNEEGLGKEGSVAFSRLLYLTFLYSLITTHNYHPITIHNAKSASVFQYVSST